VNLDWLIIGGGIHGVHIAARLLGEAGVDADRLRIVDPGEQLLERWRTCTATTGMTHLRSPSVHHLDLDPWSLQRFAGNRRNRKPGLFAPPYDRPNLALFNAHCDQVIETFGLADLHVMARTIALRAPTSLRCHAAQAGATASRKPRGVASAAVVSRDLVGVLHRDRGRRSRRHHPPAAGAAQQPAQHPRVLVPLRRLRPRRRPR